MLFTFILLVLIVSFFTTAYRMFRQRKKYTRLRTFVVLFESAIRGWIARKSTKDELEKRMAVLAEDESRMPPEEQARRQKLREEEAKKVCCDSLLSSVLPKWNLQQAELEAQLRAEEEAKQQAEEQAKKEREEAERKEREERQRIEKERRQKELLELEALEEDLKKKQSVIEAPSGKQ